MAFRSFVDARGREWEAWDTVPDGANRLVRPGFADGWLTFQSGDEKRRLAPIPPQWDTVPDAMMRLWLSQATPVSGAKRV